MTNYITLIEIISTVITIIGCILLSIPKRIGLLILIIAQVLWTIFGYLKGQYFFSFQSIFLLGINVVGLYNWKKKGIR